MLLSLPDDDEGERAAIVRDTARARDEIARALGVAPPPRVTLRFHPTTDDYEKATGQPWFTSGTLVATASCTCCRWRRCAIAVSLDRTIRHELVHLMTDTVLAQRPAWVREGAAIFFAGEHRGADRIETTRRFKPEPRTACPDDNRAAAAGVGRCAELRLRTRARVLCETDCHGKIVARCEVGAVREPPLHRARS